MAGIFSWATAGPEARPKTRPEPFRSSKKTALGPRARRRRQGAGWDPSSCELRPGSCHRASARSPAGFRPRARSCTRRSFRMRGLIKESTAAASISQVGSRSREGERWAD